MVFLIPPLCCIYLYSTVQLTWLIKNLSQFTPLLKELIAYKLTNSFSVHSEQNAKSLLYSQSLKGPTWFVLALLWPNLFPSPPLSNQPQWSPCCSNIYILPASRPWSLFIFLKWTFHLKLWNQLSVNLRCFFFFFFFFFLATCRTCEKNHKIVFQWSIS